MLSDWAVLRAAVAHEVRQHARAVGGGLGGLLLLAFWLLVAFGVEP